MRYHITMAVVTTLAVVFSCSAAQEFPLPEAVTSLGAEQAASQLKKAVFAVQIEGNMQDQDKGNDWIPIGSGFFVVGTNAVVLGVTCNHVVAKPLAAGKQIFVGLETEKEYRRSMCKVAYQDAANDIAILVPQRRTVEGLQVQNIALPDSVFDDDSSLVEGRGGIIPVYPLALGIEDDRNNPVVRLGIVAQFTGKNYFLIDGVASHRNSGSPVFALNYKNNKLVGMITSHVTDRISLLDENAQLAAQLPYNSGLARAVTMKVIGAAIQKAIGKY